MVLRQNVDGQIAYRQNANFQIGTINMSMSLINVPYITKSNSTLSDLN
jgi:hypothetical protein